MRFMTLNEYVDLGGEFDDTGNGGEVVDPKDFDEAVMFDEDIYMIDAVLREVGDFWNDSSLGNNIYLISVNPGGGATDDEIIDLRRRMRTALKWYNEALE